MPANEQTWRDQKRMHVIFGVSALVMLLATFWMMAKDHWREWKTVQLEDREKESWALNARLTESTMHSATDLERLENELTSAKSQEIEVAAITAFQNRVLNENTRLQEAGREGDSTNLDQMEQLRVQLVEASAKAADARQAVEKAVEATTAAMQKRQEAEKTPDEGETLSVAQEAAQKALDDLRTADDARIAAETEAIEVRGQLLKIMDGVIREAKRREDGFVREKKNLNGERTAAVSMYGLAVDENAPTQKIESKIKSLDERLTQTDLELAAAKGYRTDLEAIRNDITSIEAEIDKQLAAVHADLARFHEQIGKNTTNWRERVTRLPILDALYDGNIRIDQIWLPEMKINYNFSSVARFDRCTTCHRAIDKTAPGSAIEPAFPPIPESERIRTVALTTPEAAPQPQISPRGTESPPSLYSVYGLALAPEGQIDESAVTVQVVMPESLAAKSGLEMGDVLLEINGTKVKTLADAESYLMKDDYVTWGEPIALKIERGLPQPYTSHPRLDLFVGSLSPHKKEVMGCTICHDGQGSATEFKWASHTPNSPDQAGRWGRKHGWFDNHHWIFPMTPQRFLESNCLKCHHDVVELEPSERFPEPPAPKLVSGYHLIRDYGCYGCHEVNGNDGPARRIGPDIRLAPNYHEAAAALLAQGELNDEERTMAEALVESPNDGLRNELFTSIKKDAALKASQETQDDARMTATTHGMADLLKDSELPGELRKVGPSLRYLGAKVEFDWLFSWIRQPSDFRPTTRMPQFFGLHEHLDKHGKDFSIVRADGTTAEVSDLEFTKRYEAVEIWALTEFLLAESQEFAYLEPPADVTESASADRGQWLFQSRGCLACHSHDKFEGIDSNQGPDLSRLAAKFQSGKGQRWLYSWLKQPHLYHPRTVMPNLYLDPITQTDANGQPTGVVSDPAADIASYLLSVPADWQPENVPDRQLDPERQQALSDLTAEWLLATFPRTRAAQYASAGIPASQAHLLKGDEQVLLGMTDENRVEKQMQYVARRTINRYGCFGCHDIPGFESSKPIGTALADWGRKEPGKLAFESIGQFLATHGIDGQGGAAHGGAAHSEEEHANHGLDPRDFDPDTGFYLSALNSHQRTGFIWQKLRMPRSYDYQRTTNKGYTERLRMPRFPLDEQQREEIITFVLGLVNEAPAEQFVYRPGPREEAIVEGRKVLHKYNCGGCHVLDMEQWKFAFDPDWFDEPPIVEDYPFVAPEPSATAVAESLQLDMQGLMDAHVFGMPTLSGATGKPSLVDEDGVELEPDDTESDPFYEFTLYRNAVVAGFQRLIGLQNLPIPAAREGYGPANGTAYPGWGGDLAKYLFAPAVAFEQQTNPQVKPFEAWGWLPPPLHDEGVKVQPDWLHAFLLDPHPIRPAALLRMPNFRMTPDEATKLVNYFAATAGAEYPYEYNPRRRESHLVSIETTQPNHLDDAMKIVTDNNYCVKCHAVGDFQPTGSVATLGPQLGEVYKRLRPEFVRRWIANPQRVLPYTGMPVNIPYKPDEPGVSAALYPGTATEQLDAVVDLLMNFDEYAKRRTSIKPLVSQPPATPEGEAPPPAAGN
ncbi:MAG: PDZ domain-containing protein [Pirellulales bacterium]